MSAASARDKVFGENFTEHIIDLGHDDEGPLVATVVHHSPRRRYGHSDHVRDRPPLLLIHGWSDYIFNDDLIVQLHAMGLDVWGIDLRKHGRSIRPGQTPTAIDRLEDYAAEIDVALELIGRDRPPIVLGHSTGGLTAVLWALTYPSTMRGLILNSPWLEFQAGPVGRRLLRPLVRAVAARAPYARILPRGTSHYARTTHRAYEGAADYDLDWKPARGHPFPANTLSAVLDAQTRVARSGPLRVPALVLHSRRTRFGLHFRPSMHRSDVVVHVGMIARAAARLGPMVRSVALDGARHDVFLSEPVVRRRALAAVEDWLRTVVGGRHTMDPGTGRGSTGVDPS